MAREHLEEPHVALVELVQPQLRDHDHADRPRAVEKRHGDHRLVDRARSWDLNRELAPVGVGDQERLPPRRCGAGHALAELDDQRLDALVLVDLVLAAKRDRNEQRAVVDVDATGVIVDQRPELVHDRLADQGDVVEAVQLAGQALEHLQMGDRAQILLPARPARPGRPGRSGLVDDDLVLPTRLRRQHRHVCADGQLPCARRVARSGRDPDRHVHRARGVELAGRELPGDPVGQRPGRLGVGSGLDDDELLAADPAHVVLGPGGRAENPGDA